MVLLLAAAAASGSGPRPFTGSELLLDTAMSCGLLDGVTVGTGARLAAGGGWASRVLTGSRLGVRLSNLVFMLCMDWVSAVNSLTGTRTISSKHKHTGTPQVHGE